MEEVLIQQMFYLNKNTDLTPELIQKFINKFNNFNKEDLLNGNFTN